MDTTSSSFTEIHNISQLSWLLIDFFDERSYFKGLKQPGKSLKMVIDHILGDLQPRCVSVYIDGITIYSPSMEQHIHDLNEVFHQFGIRQYKGQYWQDKAGTAQIFGPQELGKFRRHSTKPSEDH